MKGKRAADQASTPLEDPQVSPEDRLARRFQSLDLLATLVAVVSPDGGILFVNAALEDALGISRRSMAGVSFPDWFTEPQQLVNALQGAKGNEFAALRYDAWLKRLGHDPLQVHVVVVMVVHAVHTCAGWLVQQQQQQPSHHVVETAQCSRAG